jgi:hypothetical protein
MSFLNRFICWKKPKLKEDRRLIIANDPIFNAKFNYAVSFNNRNYIKHKNI